MKLERGRLYPLADRPTRAEAHALGVKPSPFAHNVRALWSGETRPPKVGEWFLSGAHIEAYRAHSDLTAPRPIARLARIEKVEVATQILLATQIL